MKSKVSEAVMRRLPRYRRYLGELREKGVEKISSSELGEIIGYTASQIRQDFNTFGGFGQQGFGYSVERLYNEISKILGLDNEYKVVVVGIGNMGKAITNFLFNYNLGFDIIGLFDSSDKVIGSKIKGVEVKNFNDFDKFAKDNKVDIGVICVNKESARDVFDRLTNMGTRGIWNFAPIDLKTNKAVSVENVHITDSLQVLSFMMSKDK